MIEIIFNNQNHINEIINGNKNQTIRLPKNRKFEIGKELKIYYNNKYITTALITNVKLIKFIDYSNQEREKLSIEDGFKNWNDMYSWFYNYNKNHGNGNNIMKETFVLIKFKVIK